MNWRQNALGWCFGLLYTCALQAAPLQIALGESKMPYVDAATQSGIEYELVTRALRDAGYAFEVQYFPNKRAQIQFAQGRLDATIVTAGAIVSDPYIAYQNMAITLCERRITVSQVSDLANYQTGAFHNASKFLGNDFARIAANPERYREASPQILLNYMLLAQRIDVAISDINIFQHEQLEADPQARKPLCSYALFPPTLYRLQFRDPLVRDRFNLALAHLRSSGFYGALARKYKLPLDRNSPYFKP